MKYGYFDKENREYVITQPDTPKPWINYLNNGKYCAMISNTGGGYSFYIDPKDQRILRYRYNNLPIDRPGRYIYIKDLSSTKRNDFWSATWQPTMSELDSYECRHGMGYTTITSEKNNIHSSVQYFVPKSENIEIWRVSIKNTGDSPKKIKIFSYAEFCIGDAAKDQRDLQYIQNVAVADFHQDLNAITFNFFDKSRPTLFFSMNEPIHAFDCDREEFIGLYHSESNPKRIEEGNCSNSKALGGNPIAATEKEIQLNPHENFEYYYILGIASETAEISKITSKYQGLDIIDREFKKLKENWNQYLDQMVVSTPDPNFNLIVNTWNPYQCKMTFDWARYASFYETGLGRGIGFRDCHQDMMAVCHLIPNLVRSRIVELTATQFTDGKVFHKYFPLTKKGAFPDYTNPRMKFFADDHLWMIFSIKKYIQETGDKAILHEIIPYVDGNEIESLYNHLKRAIQFTSSNLGPHGFPLIGTADWNDCMQLHGPKKHGESIMVAMQYVKACYDLSLLARLMENHNDVSYYMSLSENMKKHINDKAWDGSWYLRGFADDGAPIGTQMDEEGQIFLNTQTWAVISKVASFERGKQCMDWVKKYLVTDYGIKLFHPPYQSANYKVNGLAAFPPGLKENAAIFCHTNPWAEIAETILRRGDYAYNYYQKISPTSKNDIAEIHQTEPYVYSQMITGIDHPKFGEAKNSWLTGTASWTLQAATDYILGIRPDFNGLIIDPCIPKNWNEYSVVRNYRGATYKIQVKNPDHKNSGVKQITIDGVDCEDLKCIPIYPKGESHEIIVIL